MFVGLMNVWSKNKGPEDKFSNEHIDKGQLAERAKGRKKKTSVWLRVISVIFILGLCFSVLTWSAMLRIIVIIKTVFYQKIHYELFKYKFTVQKLNLSTNSSKNLNILLNLTEVNVNSSSVQLSRK